MIYLDNHATTRVAPEVLQTMLPYFTENYGNAASINHAFGWQAADAVKQAREQVARRLNCPADWIAFTSGATEANNLAIKGVMSACRIVGQLSKPFKSSTLMTSEDVAGLETRATKNTPHFITNVAEHHSVLDVARRLQRNGIDVTLLPVDRFGQVDPQQVADAITPRTVLVSTMLANNEVGTLNPIVAIGHICRERDILLHCDAVQAFGKLSIDLMELPIDLLSLTAHKLHGPKGVGALVVRRDRRRIPIEPLFDGGGHEQHLRSGTLPVPLIVGFGTACELSAEMSALAERMSSLRDRLWQRLQSELSDLSLNGHPTARLPNNLNVSFAGVDGEALMTSLKTIAVSSGSACSTAEPEPSHVLRAMRVSESLSRASLRFGLSRYTTEAEIEAATHEVVAVVKRLRGRAPN
ncbi:MAG: cysteine desulfurase family protein [Planctomycetia bacterium]|nr:cysteine desulfurase family protein [Planctomycetia bacterium]